jgi:hypothetical protein
MTPARVRSIDKLEEFRVNLIRFKAQMLEVLDSPETAIRFMEELLQDQMNYRRREVLRRREILDRSSRESRLTAQRDLKRADADLLEIMKWRRLVLEQALSLIHI